MSLIERIEQLAVEAEAKLRAAEAPSDLDDLEVRYLGRKGLLTGILRGIKDLPPGEKPKVGQAANVAKEQLRRVSDDRRRHLEEVALEAALRGEAFDVTAPGPRPRRGHLHPITQMRHEVEDLFATMGFEVVEGPEVESSHYNFEALNIPDDHPARDTMDTFWIDLAKGVLLRTHTSPVQVRAMQRRQPPIRAIAPGRVFRQEAVDASHQNTFYQVEGLYVDRGVSVAHLIHVMRTLLEGIFRREVEVRLRPGYFPFVEPGFELDIRCFLCAGRGCPVCKQVGWLELLPCGLVHPNVLRAGGVDPEVWSGFAFGLGLDRLVMMRYGIRDIRLFLGGDLRFLRQF